MKVLLYGQVIGSRNVPEEQMPAMLLDGLREYKQDSRTEQVYGFAGEWGGVIVCNVDSARELDEYVSLNPMAEFVQWEIHNVSTLDEQISVMEKIAKHAESKQRAA